MLPLEHWVWGSFNPTDTCWLWEAGGHPRYGKIGGTAGCPSVYGEYAGQYAHRAVWAMLHGPIPPGKCVLHECDTPRCIRPDHLFLGSQADNMHDRNAKGRQAKGEQARKSKLTEADIREIRRRYVPRKISTTMLAKEFGVLPHAIWSIIKRKTWAHVP